ncbi:MAG: serine/threonine-protein kinase, partial [Cystobacter sp.]
MSDQEWPSKGEGGEGRLDDTYTVDEEVRSEPRPLPASGSILAGRYTVLEVLGEGGMSVVLAAYDVQLDRRVAIKLLRHAPHQPEDDARSELRMVREAQAMARLKHPNVVAVYDSGRLEDGSFFIAMEYVEGQTLRQWRKEQSRGWRDVLGTFLDAGHGLAAAHAAGLIHRDFKPDNVLVGRDGRVLVTDFGVARTGAQDECPPLPAPIRPGAWDSKLTLSGFVVGTPRYLAPELLRGEPADARSDVFSFCVALYEALCDQPVFQGESDLERGKSRLEGRINPPPAHLPAWVMRSVLQGLSADPGQRPPTMSALLHSLAEDPEVRRREWRGRLKRIAAGVVLAGVAVVGWMQQRAQAPICGNLEQELVGVWDDPVRQRVRQSLEGTRLAYAPATTERVFSTLDDYTRTWLRQRTAACEGLHPEAGEQPRGLAVLQEYCLERARGRLRALTELLGRGSDAELVTRAVEAARGLPPLAYCEDARVLTAAVPPPEDPGVRARAETLQREVDRLEALYEAGKYAEGITFGEALLPRVAEVPYPPLRARTLYQLAQNLEGAGEFKRAEARVREVIPLAAEGRDDALHARAWGLLTLLLGDRQGRYDDQGLALITAAAAARTEDALARAEALNALGTWWNGQSHYDEAQACFESAMALWQQVRGPRHPYVAGFRINLGIALLERGSYEEALENIVAAQDIWEEVLGPEHPYLVHALVSRGVALWKVGRPE